MVVLCVSGLLSQTEVWRVNGHYQLHPDGIGGAYLFRLPGTYYTLSRVSETGEVRWTTKVHCRYDVITVAGNAGIYAVPIVMFHGHQTDSIWYYDSTGVPKWTYELPSSVTLRNGPGNDRKGNLVLVYDSVSTPPSPTKLLCINESGNIDYCLSLPSPDSDPRDYEFAFTEKNNVWIILSTGSDTLGFYQQQDAYLFDRFNGKLSRQKTISKSKSRRGWAESIIYYLFEAVGEKLVAAGGSYSRSEKVKRGVTEVQEGDDWRIATINPSGGIFRWKFKGSGKSRWPEGSRWWTSSIGNNLIELAVGNSNDLYLHGQVAQPGATSLDPPTSDDVILRFDVQRHKVLWKRVANNQTRFIIFSDFEQRVLYSLDGLTFDAYDMNGSLTKSILKFPIEVYAPNVYWDQFGGFYVSPAYDSSGAYVAKYSLSGLLSQPTSLTEGMGSVEEMQSFSLNQNYPNPFNPTTTISFTLPEDAMVTLKVYNSLGQEVATLAEREEFMEGENELDFDASNLPSGVYFYRLTAEGISDEEGNRGQVFNSVKKMLLVK